MHCICGTDDFHTYVEVVVHLDHRRVHARAEALDLGEREQPVRARLASLDAQVRLDRVPAHTTQGAEAARTRSAG